MTGSLRFLFAQDCLSNRRRLEGLEAKYPELASPSIKRERLQIPFTRKEKSKSS
jgi:hypothetical protein